MAFLVRCEHCNAIFVSKAFGGSGTLYLKNVRTNCPSCRGMTPIADGTYEIADSTLTAMRGLNAADIRRFHDLLAEVQGGSSSTAAVVAEAQALDPNFGRIVAVLQALGGLPLLIALIGLYLQWAVYNEDSADQDAVLSELRAANAHQEQLLAGMRDLIAAQSTPEPQPYLPQKPHTSHTPPSEASGSDRAAKRRAWKQEKKASKDKSIRFRR